MGTFAVDLQRFAEKCGERADDAVGNIVVRIAQELDKRSPVGDSLYWKNPPPKGYIGGHFRANWQLGVGSMPAGEIPGVDPSGAKTLGRIMAAVPDQAAGKVYWIANNTKYSLRIEHGWSRQAPQGIVGLTTVMFQEIVEDAIKALP